MSCLLSPRTSARSGGWKRRARCASATLAPARATTKTPGGGHVPASATRAPSARARSSEPGRPAAGARGTGALARARAEARVAAPAGEPQPTRRGADGGCEVPSRHPGAASVDARTSFGGLAAVDCVCPHSVPRNRLCNVMQKTPAVIMLRLMYECTDSTRLSAIASAVPHAP
ncbi:hypothetical protein NUW54_g13137 [Trametes sanguinea]|uniref:Uncharacterized protein n=1 Tax=Trametes sanguinea TaxID=158606 RepID=A0ACC1MP15_9APHY|nr:hypothetical protein NUW54_g13137 [Trametes sanguinea]